MVDINFTFVLFTASFMAFVLLMKLVFFDPVKSVIQKRESIIEKNLEESKAAISNIKSADSGDSSPSQILKEAKLKSHQIVSELMNQANKERLEMVNKELKDLKTNTEKAILGLEKEQNAILKNLDSYVSELSKEALDKLMAELDAHATA